MPAMTRALVAFAHVASVERSITFYSGLGFTVVNSVTPDGTTAPSWAWLTSENANLMIGTASGAVDSTQQAVLFYLYFNDIQKTRSSLLELGYEPGEIRYPFYMPAGECRLEDPDGYVLMLAQA